MIAWIYSCEQKINDNKKKIIIEPELETKPRNSYKDLTTSQDLAKFIYTDTTYTFSNGERIVIQNSLPKGGSISPEGTQYIDSRGKRYAFAVFWTRIFNETNSSIEISINFPADSFAIFTPTDSYLKLLLPKDTLRYEKLTSFNYGLTETKSFLDSNFNRSSKLQKKIKPNEEFAFYIATLTYKAEGTPRAELFLKDYDIYYKMSVSPHGEGVVPVGKIILKDNYSK